MFFHGGDKDTMILVYFHLFRIKNPFSYSLKLYIPKKALSQAMFERGLPV